MTIHFETQVLNNKRILKALLFYDLQFDTTLKSFIHHLVIINNVGESFYRIEGSDIDNAVLFMSESNCPEQFDYKQCKGETIFVNLNLPLASIKFREQANELLSEYLIYNGCNFEWIVSNNAPKDCNASFNIPQRLLRKLKTFNWP
jgi:hypothetical protein